MRGDGAKKAQIKVNARGPRMEVPAISSLGGRQGVRLPSEDTYAILKIEIADAAGACTIHNAHPRLFELSSMVWAPVGMVAGAAGICKYVTFNASQARSRQGARHLRRKKLLRGQGIETHCDGSNGRRLTSDLYMVASIS